MWQWLKSNLIEPVGNFFSGIFTRIRTAFTRRAQYQPVPNELLHPKNDSDNVESMYELLPNELQVKIFDYLKTDQPVKAKSNFITGLFGQRSVSAQSALINTSRLFHDALQPKRFTNILLSLAADATQPAVDKLLTILDKNPSLLREKGNVITRGGDEVRGVTLYEFCLGAGDPELAILIAPHFSKIDDGEALRERQYNRYKPHIDAIQTQAPYDLNALIEIIINSSNKNVTACLNKNFDHESELNTALKQFREDHAPRVITKPCMHYNYSTLQQAFDLLYNILRTPHTNNDKGKLVARQVIGYLQRSLPAIDRFAFSQAFTDEERTLTLRWKPGSTFTDNSLDVASAAAGLGFDHIILGVWPRLRLTVFGRVGETSIRFRNSLQTKISSLQSLCSRNDLRSQRPTV